MAIEANPIIQTTQVSLHTNPAVATQAATQNMPEFQKQQRLLSQNTAAANQTGQSAQTSQTGHAAQAFISHGQTAQLRNDQRRSIDQRAQDPQATESRGQTTSASGVSQAPITQQDLENSFVNLLRENIGHLHGNQENFHGSELGSESYTMNFLHNNYMTRVLDQNANSGSMILLEKKNSMFHDTMGVFGDHVYAPKPEYGPIMYFANH